MNIVTNEQIAEWLRLDPDTDEATLGLLVDSAIDVISHETGLQLRPFLDPLTQLPIVPTVPASLKHAIAVFVAAHFSDREGEQDMAMVTIRRLCAPFRVARL
jgi:hypothetical protein